MTGAAPVDISTAMLDGAEHAVASSGADVAGVIEGWAKALLRRAHHFMRECRWNGGHAPLCPSYGS